jgi:hypothetical protein
MRALLDLAATVVLGLLLGSLITVSIHGTAATIEILHALLVYVADELSPRAL